MSTITTMYPTGVDFATLDEIRSAALANLTSEVGDFLEGGAGSEKTLRRNRDAFDRRCILPEPMSGVTAPATATSLLQIDLAAPLLIAPFGGDTLFHSEGHRAAAEAAATAGIVDIVPEAGGYTYEDVRAIAPASARIAQLHPFDQMPSVAQRIAAAGFDALCVTLDCPIAGHRTRNMRNRFSPDLSCFAGNLASSHSGPRVAEVMGQLVAGGDSAWSWRELRAAAADFELPWIGKGVLTAPAAMQALEAGASALIVSNHGGRQLDPAPASLDVLPSIRSAVGPDIPIVLDSGIRSGADLFIALACGADAAVIGRPAVYGLAAAGAAGVSRVIELIVSELTTIMTLAGTASIDAITADHVQVSER